MILSLAALMILGAADPDGVVTTAARADASATAGVLAGTALDAEVGSAPTPSAQDAAPHGLTTNDQIEQWIARRTPGATYVETGDAGPADDRQIHGEVSAGIGTNGYRSWSAAVSLPIGERGRLDLAYSESKNDPYGYYGGRYGYGPYGYDYGYGYEPGYGRERGYARPFANDGVSRRMSVGVQFGESVERRPFE